MYITVVNRIIHSPKVNLTNPPTYILKYIFDQTIEGCFYELELQKTKYPDIYLVEKILRRRGRNKILNI